MTDTKSNSTFPFNEPSLPLSSAEQCNEAPAQRAVILDASLPKTDEFVQGVQKLFDVRNQSRPDLPSQPYLNAVTRQACCKADLANARTIYDRALSVPLDAYFAGADLYGAHTASIPAPPQQQRQMQQSHVPEGFLADTPWPMPHAAKSALFDTLLGTNGPCLPPIAAAASKIAQKAPMTLTEALAAEIQSRQAARAANKERRQAEDVAPRATAKPAKKETIVAEEIPPTFESARWRMSPPTLELCRFQGRLYTNMQAAAKHAAAAPDSTRLFLAMLHLGIAVSKHESVFSNPFEQRVMFLVGNAIFDTIERGLPLKFTTYEDDLFVAYVDDVLKRI